MIDTKQINDILGIKEAYQLHDALEEILFDKSKREKTFKDFLNIESDLSYDWFTNYFQEEQSNRKSMMQDYTPDCICKILGGIQKGNAQSVLDECSGIGGLTISTWMQDKNRTFYLEELSENSIMVLLFNLSIRGVNAYVRHGDVLTNTFDRVWKLTKNGQFSDIKEVAQGNGYNTDIVISNPPYSLKFENCESYANDPRFAYFGLPPKAKADYAFILHALSHLKEHGEAYFILPHGVLFRGAKEEKIRKSLIEKNLIDTVIGLPDKLFLNTDIPVCILVLKLNRDEHDVLFIEASKQFQKDGKKNVMLQEHIDKVISAYKLRQDVDKLSHVASLDEISNNDYNLNIPRYVDTSEPKKPIDIQKKINDIIAIEDDISNTEKSLIDMLQTLDGPGDYEQNRDKLVKHLREKQQHTLSMMSQSVNDFIDKNQALLMNQHEVELLDIATFERSKKKKTYPSGSILIQVSATKGQLIYMDHDGLVDSKYGVIQTDKVEPKYLYYILDMVIPDFLRRYQTGLNINPSIFKHLKFAVHDDRRIQKMIISILDSMQFGIENEKRQIDEWNKLKQYHLDGMMI